MDSRHLGSTRRKPDSATDVRPGSKNYLVYCDESGIGGELYYGFGSLWMPWEARGRFSGMLQELSQRFGYWEEIKWTKVNRHCLPFCRTLVEEFFRRSWLMFHCVLVRKAYVDMAFHKDRDEAMRKHFAMLIKAKIAFFSKGCPEKAYYVRVDPLPSRYPKADEAAAKIVANQLRQELNLAPLKSVVTRDSKDTPGIQVADLLLGAILSHWQRTPPSGPKAALANVVAECLGWPDLRADTFTTEWKCNIWHFHDPHAGKVREVATRRVVLKHPMPRRRDRVTR